MTRHKKEHGRYRPSHATVIAYLALFVALGGTAGALQGTNTVFSDDIVAQEVKSSDLRPGAVGTGKVADGTLLDKDFAPGENTARAYGFVLNSCTPASGAPAACQVLYRKGLGHPGAGGRFFVIRQSPGQYCIAAAGLDGDEIPAVASVEGFTSVEPQQARVYVQGGSPGTCPNPNTDFGVVTERMSVMGSSIVSSRSNTVSFTIVIP